MPNMNFRFLMFLCLVVFSTNQLFSATLTYSKYKTLTDDDRQKLVKKYIKKSGRWHTVKIKNYKVFCDVTEEETLKIAVMMDDFYSHFKAKFNGRFQKKNIPVMYVCKNKKSFAQTYREFTGRSMAASWAAGLYVGFKTGMLLGNHESRGFLTTMKHEGTHQLFDYYIKGRIPVWFNEGSACNFQDWDMERSLSNNLANGIFVNADLRNLARIYPDKGYIPFHKMLDISSRQWAASKTPQNQYTSVWAAVNYLLNHREGQGIYNRLIKAFRSSNDQRKVLSPALINKLSFKISRYVEQTLLPQVNYINPLHYHMTKGKRETAKKWLNALKKNLPEHPAVIFYTNWLALEEGQGTNAHLEELKKLEKDDYEHPELDYVLALAYHSQREVHHALHHARLMLKHNSAHTACEKLMEQIKDSKKKDLPSIQK